MNTPRVFVDLRSIRRSDLVNKIRQHGKEKELMLWHFGLPRVEKGGISPLMVPNKPLVVFLNRYCNETVGATNELAIS